MADGQVRFEFAEQRSASVRAASAWAPYRPVQYLGNKLRALDAISDAVRSMLRGRNGHVVDLFAGTTVVSQRLALDGHRVTATDVQRYSATFAAALLGIGRRPCEVVDPEPIARECLRLIYELPDEWAAVAQQEQRLIKASEHALLADLAATAPLIWRDPTASNYQQITTKHREVVSAETPLITSIYGGSYFGFTQAITIDLLRKAVRRLEAVGLLSIWQTAAAITAIMSAASAAAHSAGKHFAQPLSSGPKKNTAFLAKRLLEDRRVSIGERFRESVQRINANPIAGDAHRALVMTAEDFVSSADGIVDVYYLDPPYTAQQYSRFYHVLETICTYEYPRLVDDEGRMTTGLYPTERFKSAFSSKKAGKAFDHSLRNAAGQGSGVLISYSQSAEASTGNARMISLEELLAICRRHYGESGVRTDRMEHRYRQFNQSALSNQLRDDPEILITCKLH